jgi:endoglucanase
MRHATIKSRILQRFVIGVVIFLISFAGAYGQSKTLPSNTRFFVPRPLAGAMQQESDLQEQSQSNDALLITTMESVPQAVWLTGGTPSYVSVIVTQTFVEANREQAAVPVLVVYNIPGRDCGGYSSGGAANTAAYEAWIDSIAAAIGSHKVVIVLEPDALGNLPSDCGYNPAEVNIAQATADRYTQINYAVTKLETGSQTLVYIDAGDSHWQAVPVMAARLAQAGIMQAQGFFSNVSGFNLNNYEAKYDTWVSECIAFANNPDDGGWRLGNYSYCANQYYSPLGTVDPNNIATWIYTDEWFQQNLGTATPTKHFLIDTSRNGQGPFDASIYAKAPFNQPAAVVQTLINGSWCNPLARGLGIQSTANTGVPLLDAYFWVKTPGESDGTCDVAGGARAWDYAAYTQSQWPLDAADQAVFDPLWGLDDPAPGVWFPQQAIDLARRANPSLLP